MGEERTREGVATMVTDSGSVIHHPKPRPGVGAGVEGLVGFYDVPTNTSGAAHDMQIKPETEGSYDTTPSQLSRDRGGGGEGEGGGIKYRGPPLPRHPITGAETWELELGETVKRVEVGNIGVRGRVDGAAGRKSAGRGLIASVGGVGGSASGVVRTGRGRKVRAKVGGASEARGREGERVSGEKDDDKGEEKDENNAKTKGKGNGIRSKASRSHRRE